MKVHISKEWCERSAALEVGQSIVAGNPLFFMDEPAISLSSIIEPALTKFANASFDCGAHQGEPGTYGPVAAAAATAREELITTIRQYVSDSLVQALGYDPVKGHTQANGLKRIKTMDEMKRAHVQYALSVTDTMDQAARALDIDIATVFRMRKRWGMPIHEQHSAAWKDRKLREQGATSSGSE